MSKNKLNIIFFGTPEFSVRILETMSDSGYSPTTVVTTPDVRKGRKMILTPPPVKVWAEKHEIKVLQPKKLNELLIADYELQNADLFVVASYGKILPKEVLDIPKNGTINVHPSLLPRLRGPSPIQSAILFGEEKTGMTIMLMDEKMDEGPTLKISKLKDQISKLTYAELENKLAELGGEMLVEVIPKWIAGKIEPVPQNHDKATYTKIITKKDGEIDWSEPHEKIYRKIRALNPWPSAYTFVNGKRVIIIEAELNNNALAINRVKPEGKNEMSYENYLKVNSPIKTEAEE